MKKHSTRKLFIIALAVLLISVCASLAIYAVTTQDNADFGESLKSYQISLNGRVNLRFIYNSLGNADAFVAEVYTPDGNTLVRNAGTYKKADIESNKNTVSVPLAPSEMIYTVKVYPVSLDANGNVSSRGTGTSCSVKEYALAVIGSNNAAHTPYHSTMRALLNWGAMSQSFFGDATDSLANLGIYTKNTNPIAAVGNDTIVFASHDAVSINGETFTNTGYGSEGNTPAGASLLLARNDIALRFYIYTNKDNTYSASDLTATLYREGFEAAEAVTVEATGTAGKFCVEVTNINVGLFDKVYDLKVTAKDGSSLSASVSVLEYLDLIVEGKADAPSEEQKATAKALYQFYMLANTEVHSSIAASCQHGTTHWRANGSTASYLECSLCFAEIKNVPDSIEAFYDPMFLNKDYNEKSANRGGLTTKSELKYDEDGTVYVRMYGGGGTHTPDNGGDNYNDSRPFKYDSSITGRYAVLKYRLPSAQNSGNAQTKVTMYVKTYEKETSWTSNNIPSVENGEWITVVMDLAMMRPSAVVPDENGVYKGVQVWFRPICANGVGSTDDYMDVAYFAYCDNITDALEMLDQDSYQLHTSLLSYSTIYKQDECTQQHIYLEEKNSDGSNAYFCAACAKQASFDVDKYFSYSILRGLVGPYQMGASIGYDETDNSGYVRYTGQGPAGQVNYFRQPISYENKDDGTQSVNSNFGTNPAFNVKQSKYLALMYRTNNTSGWNHYMWLGTKNANTIVKGDDNKYTGSSNYAAVRLPLSKLTANEWSLMVIDLEQALGDKWLPNDNGEFVIESMLFHSGTVPADVYFDVSYIAFADSLEDVAELSGLKECLLVTKTTTGQENTATEGNMYANYYLGADTLIKTDAYQLTDTLVTDTESSYVHLVGQDNAGQVNYNRSSINPHNGASGYGKGTPFNIGKNKYMLVMFRTNNTSWTQQVHLGTKDANKMTASDYSGKSGVHYINLPFTDVQANEWTLFVIDIEKVLGSDYIANANGDYIIETMVLHSNSVASTTEYDVQYIAFADSLGDIIKISGRESAILVTASGTGSVVDLNINHKITAESLSNTKPFQMDKLLTSEDTISFVRYTGQNSVCEANYYRHPIEPKSDGNADQKFSSSVSFNIGKAKYLTLMYRTNNTAWSHRMYLGTEDANTVTYDNTTGKWSGSSNRKLIELPISNLSANTWTLLVIDLEKVLGNTWLANENGDYIMENLCFYSGTMSSDTTFDVSYMMFTESLDNIKNATGISDILYIDASGNGDFANLDNLCVGGAVAHELDTDDCTVSAYCTVCGKKVRDAIDHVYSMMKITRAALKERATETTPAVYYYSCACGALGSDTYVYGKTLTEMTDLTKSDRYDTLVGGISANNLEKFLFFTDSHPISAGANGSMVLAYEYHIDLMAKHFNASGLSFALSGGDWLYDSNTKANAIANLKDIDKRMQTAFGDDYYMIVGNHDYNYQTKNDAGTIVGGTQRLTREEMVSTWYSDARYGGHAYYSFSGTNTKFYVFDSETDWEHPNTATVTDYDKEQIIWFLEQLSANNDAHIALAPHILYSSGTTLHGGTAKLLEFSEVYNNRGSVTYEGKTYDFSGKTGRVEFLIAGHTHKDVVEYYNGIPCVLTVNAATGTYPKFDMVAIDYSTRIMYTVRVSSASTTDNAKSDRTIALDKPGE